MRTSRFVVDSLHCKPRRGSRVERGVSIQAEVAADRSHHAKKSATT
jgi:hypothetical protein